MSLSLDVDVRLVVRVLLSNWPTDRPVVAVATLLPLVTMEVDMVTVEVVPVVVRLGKLWAPMRGEAENKQTNKQQLVTVNKQQRLLISLKLLLGVRRGSWGPPFTPQYVGSTSSRWYHHSSRSQDTQRTSRQHEATRTGFINGFAQTAGFWFFTIAWIKNSPSPTRF